jgi:hypothetical protein
MSENEENKQVSAVPTDAVVAYLSDLYRQLDSISFNIRTNITNILPKVEGEATDVSNQDEVR